MKYLGDGATLDLTEVDFEDQDLWQGLTNFVVAKFDASSVDLTQEDFTDDTRWSQRSSVTIDLGDVDYATDDDWWQVNIDFGDLIPSLSFNSADVTAGTGFCCVTS